MKTEDLIRTMAADLTRPPPLDRTLGAALFVATALAALVFYGAFGGVRPDFWAAAGRLDVLLKQGFPFLLAAAAFGACLRMSRPEARLGAWAAALLVGPAVAAAAFWTTAIATPLADWPATIRGRSVTECLTLIPTIAVPILVGALWALRRGAGVHPALCGALAGLLAGSCSAAVYAAYCTDDSPMFWGVWYMLAIALVTAAGALAGARLLRW